MLGASLVIFWAATLPSAGEADIAAASHPPGDCSLCHTADNWQQVTVNHDRTQLPLDNRHAQVPCRACHLDLRQLNIDARCGACHQDPHAGRLGDRCQRCHQTSSFRDGASVDAHAQSRFPLYGRHAMVPCEQCHQLRSDRAFGRLDVRCISCHAADYRRTAGTAVDHTQANLGPLCRSCHNAVSWGLASFAEHEACFPLTRGHHRNIACLSCHTALTGLAVQSCTSFSASCSRCHACSEMDSKHREEGVPGYQCADRKCYECHPSGSG